ncbi:MAG TPA: hypothetical protein P5110_07465 [Candidatus Omnitrophota bacterium]|nr:hypothetical protein [Candidatus Omnitrophota bacterium]
MAAKTKEMTAQEMVEKLEFMGCRVEEIAFHTGISAGTVYRWMKGTEPHRTFKKKLIELYETYLKRFNVQKK